jgi:phosphoglycolate phosphatase
VSRFRLVVFDLDGTLIDSRPDIAAALNHALADFGLPPWSEAEIEPMIGEGARVLVERAIAGRLDPARHAEVLADYSAWYERESTVRTRVYPGVEDGLRALAGVRRAVATNKPGALSRTICDALGLSALVDLVLGEGDVPRRKPDPAMLDAAMARLHADRASTLYVGDGPIDVLTARAAGVPLCLVSWGYRRGEPMAHAPDFTADTFADVTALVA